MKCATIVSEKANQIGVLFELILSGRGFYTLRDNQCLGPGSTMSEDPII